MNKLTIEQIKKETRLEEWKKWLEVFMQGDDQNSSPDFVTIPHAAELLNDYYWRLTLDFIKPLLDIKEGEEMHHIHFYKIISASELTVMAVLPFTFDDNARLDERKRINANFAWFIGISIILNWKIDNKELVDIETLEKVFYYKELIYVDDEKNPVYYWVSFRDEHIDYLKDLNTAAPLPVLSNSHTWRLLFLATLSLPTVNL